MKSEHIVQFTATLKEDRQGYTVEMNHKLNGAFTANELATFIFELQKCFKYTLLKAVKDAVDETENKTSLN